ncbi:hypothetical protein ACOQFL_19770 [Actinopolyspora sp. H202]|uniref:hypothetical protein n=1 Tax=Actinopolyspora sp. H202 TaxID=1500456 RepID=UPI003EE7FF41
MEERSWLATRLEETACFEVPPSSAYITDPSNTNHDSVVEDDTLYAVRAATEGLAVQGRRASVGRGAEGFGAVVEVVVTFGGIGGAFMTVEWAINKTLAAYRALWHHLGRRPNVSLGAARFLAAADLTQRIKHSNFTLANSGEVDPNVPDRSFTGDDTFWAIFSDFPYVYIYIISSSGRVHYIGSHEIRAGAGSRLRFLPAANGRRARLEPEEDN